MTRLHEAWQQQKTNSQLAASERAEYVAEQRALRERAKAAAVIATQITDKTGFSKGFPGDFMDSRVSPPLPIGPLDPEDESSPQGFARIVVEHDTERIEKVTRSRWGFSKTEVSYVRDDDRVSRVGVYYYAGDETGPAADHIATDEWCITRSNVTPEEMSRLEDRLQGLQLQLGE